jgi:hypothetical protein
VRYHAVVLVVAGVLAYATSFSNPFLYDDQTAIVKNTQIRTLSPLSVPLTPPRDTPVAGRPLANLSLAVNYAYGGLDVTSYHVTNLALHLLVALVLFGIVRRTLLLGRPEGLQPHADGLALAAALVWVLHPLNSEVVNYLVQRTESLMALCYLATLYCAIRAHAHPDRWGWRAAAIAACAAGMASKESMVTAPLMVLVYDRVFLYPSLGAAIRERRALYIGLAATWAVLAALMLGQPRTSGGVCRRRVVVDVFPQPAPDDRALPVADALAASAGRGLRPAACAHSRRRDRARPDPAGARGGDGAGAAPPARAGIPGRVVLRDARADIEHRADCHRSGRRAPDVSPADGARGAGRGGRVHPPT